MPETKQLFASPRCQHVHYSGRPCKAPARRGRNYCVFHQAAHLDPGGCVLPIIEDVHSYQLAIIRIARALADDVIDSKKATALLYALQLAGSKLTDFVKQRDEIENPAVALKKEISERYDARHHPFPSYISEKEVIAILREMRGEQPAEPDETIQIIPQQPIAIMDSAVPSAPHEVSPAVHCRVSDAPSSSSAVGTTDSSCPQSSVPTGVCDEDYRAPGVQPPGCLHDVPSAHPSPVPSSRPSQADIGNSHAQGAA